MSITGQALYLTQSGDTGAISVNDIAQGGYGDCFLLASIAEEAYWRPDLISNAIHDNGDGTQNVTLYKLSYDSSYKLVQTATSVLVKDSELPSGAVNSGRSLMVNGVTELWPQIMEAAYVNLMGGLSSISNGGLPYLAMMHLTPGSAVELAPSQVTASMLKADQAAGNMITFDTLASGNLSYGLIASHSYYFKGMQTINGKDYVSLGNPWGYAQPDLVPVSDMAHQFSGIDIQVVPAAAPVAQVAAPVATAAPTPTPTPAPIVVTTTTITPTPTPIPAASTGLVLNVSEDAWMGDAQFTVTIDGNAVGTYTATASHAAGQTQAITIASSLSQGSHKIGVTFTNDAYGGSAAMDRNLYVDGATLNGVAISGSASTLMSNQTNAFGVVAPASAAGLVINVAEDAYQGDAQFTVSVDGQTVGGTYTATASHGAGQSQAFTIATSLGSGQHDVAISFINDAYGGSSSTDRNLYVTGASYNGTAIQGAEASLYSNATSRFVVPAASGLTSTAILNVSEDAYQGDAQFTVSVDGKQYGGVYTATASHAAGASQAITISGIPEGFKAHDLALTFLNDAYGGTSATDRNLYLNSVQFDGQTVAGSTRSLFSASTEHVSLLAPANYAG
jgi:hypothetical protein